MITKGMVKLEVPEVSEFIKFQKSCSLDIFQASWEIFRVYLIAFPNNGSDQQNEFDHGNWRNMTAHLNHHLPQILKTSLTTLSHILYLIKICISYLVTHQEWRYVSSRRIRRSQRWPHRFLAWCKAKTSFATQWYNPIKKVRIQSWTWKADS